LNTSDFKRTLVSIFDRLLPGNRRWHLAVICGLGIATIQFASANLAQFNFDDYQLIVLNPSIRGFDHLGTVLASGRPLRGLSFMLDYALFGMDASGYHQVNVAWHFFATVLFYLLVFRLLGSVGIAALAAVLFALHPIHTEAVMAIAHRKEMLAFSFMLLSFHAYLYRQRRPVMAIGASLVFFMLALLSKQVTIVLPLLLVLHEWLRSGGGFRRDFLRLWPWLVFPAVLLIGGALISAPILRDFNFFGMFSPAELKDADYFRILASAFKYYPRHLQGLLFPVHLTAAPRIDLVTFRSPAAWFGVLSFLALGAAAVRARKDYLLSFSLAWVFINLLPIMNWIPANTFYADRYLYIPSAGYCLLIAGLWQRLYYQPEPVAGVWARELAAFAMLAVILGLVAIAPPAARITLLWPFPQDWHMDPSQAIGIAGAMAALLAAAAVSLLQTRRLDLLLERRAWLEYFLLYLIAAALTILTLILAEVLIERRFGLPAFNMAKKFAQLHQWIATHARPGPRAGQFLFYASGTSTAEIANVFIFQFSVYALCFFALLRLERRSRKVSANRRLAWRVLVLILVAMNAGSSIRVYDWSSEIRLWRTVILEDPKSLYGWNNLGKAYLDRHRFDLAAAAFERAARIAPEMPEPYRNLGMTALGLGDLKRAQRAFSRVLAIVPTDQSSLLNLANIMVVAADRGKAPDGYRQAVKLYLRVLELDPAAANAHRNLAYCYYRSGAYPRAQEEINRALLLDPESQDYHSLRAEIEAAMER
jgi:tetratricopeptide (TPR) repeat protein